VPRSPAGGGGAGDRGPESQTNGSLKVTVGMMRDLVHVARRAARLGGQQRGDTGRRR
jgi:hypothetical protein